MTQGISKERVGALSDGVIAIAATILVLELKVPEQTEISRSIVLEWVRVMAGWAISFAMIAVIWFDNHMLFRHARAWSAPLAVLNFGQLAAVSLVPFFCNLIIDHPENLPAAIGFSAVMLLNGLLSAGMSRLLANDSENHSFDHTGRLLYDRARGQLATSVLTASIAVVGAVMHHPFLGVALWAISPMVVSLRLFAGKAAAADGHEARPPRRVARWRATRGFSVL